MSVDGQLLERWRAEEREQPEGWDFSSLDDRMSQSQEPWDLDAQYRQALSCAQHVLDMGTGGGEYLLRFAALLPIDTTATEGWQPNISVAQRNLAPHGIEVIEYGAPDEDVDSVRMPFADDRFDLVLNRHESYSPHELARVIAPGGTVLTQQVGGDECAEIGGWFGQAAALPHVNFAQFREELQDAGFSAVDGAEHVGVYTFEDVAALLAYLQLVPWETPDDFSVDRYQDRLLDLHRRSSGGLITMTRKRFWLKGVRQ